jgi:hypothetical protein
MRHACHAPGRRMPAVGSGTHRTAAVVVPLGERRSEPPDENLAQVCLPLRAGEKATAPAHDLADIKSGSVRAPHHGKRTPRRVLPSSYFTSSHTPPDLHGRIDSASRCWTAWRSGDLGTRNGSDVRLYDSEVKRKTAVHDAGLCGTAGDNPRGHPHRPASKLLARSTPPPRSLLGSDLRVAGRTAYDLGWSPFENRRHTGRIRL